MTHSSPASSNSPPLMASSLDSRTCLDGWMGGWMDGWMVQDCRSYQPIHQLHSTPPQPRALLSKQTPSQPQPKLSITIISPQTAAPPPPQPHQEPTHLQVLSHLCIRAFAVLSARSVRRDAHPRPCLIDQVDGLWGGLVGWVWWSG